VLSLCWHQAPVQCDREESQVPPLLVPQNVDKRGLRRLSDIFSEKSIFRCHRGLSSPVVLELTRVLVVELGVLPKIRRVSLVSPGQQDLIHDAATTYGSWRILKDRYSTKNDLKLPAQLPR